MSQAGAVDASVEDVANEIAEFFRNAKSPVLFTGAGVSVRAGLPTWKDLVEKLSEGIRSKDQLTAQQMRNCVNEGRYTLAVEYFLMSPSVLEGEKRTLIQLLLSDYDATKIEPIAALPFSACITTNFDRSIHDAIAAVRKKAPKDFRYGDASFKEAIWVQDLFVARIHGAVEAPGSIVLSQSAFAELKKNETYEDLLRGCFTQRNVLFVGFSFYDPAIKEVFEEIDARFGPASPGRHVALLPDDASSDFISKANRLNIKIVKYSSKDRHSELWASIARVPKLMVPTNLQSVTVRVPAPFDAAKRYLAACYARVQTSDTTIALRTTVTEGVVSALLQEAAPKALTRPEILEGIRRVLGIKGRPAETLVDGALQALRDDGLCRRHKGEAQAGSKFAWIEAPSSSSMADALGLLTQSALNRAYLQEGWTIPNPIAEKVSALFSYLVVRRGWDLGAAFAAGKPPENVAIEPLILDSGIAFAAYDLERLDRILTAMFQRPTEEEARILGELGRVSFAVELAFQSPGSALLHKAVLPTRIYFDASVLMPAIVDGHPFHSVYSDSLKRLKQASASAATQLHLKVSKVYLNEIISHRNIAEAYCRQVGDEFLQTAQFDAMYNGATNVNVFVGGYANWAHINGDLSFDKYLARVAPYKTEIALRKWLEKNGYEVVEPVRGARYAQIYGLLERDNASRLVRGKDPILLQHDALQLSLLDADMTSLERSIFVTADRHLRDVIAGSNSTAHLTEVMVSHVGLVQMIELLLGGVRDDAGLAELLWSTRISSQAMAMHSFLVARGLQQYDDGIAMTLSGVVEKFADRADRELKRDGLDLGAEEPTKRANAFKKLGALEKNYMRGMREAVEKLKKQQAR
ncbi:SIR2-like protein [Panacagrimonas perspica]|uniref:SIR2-like protein n=1 Tax=Panacagrimonas perspica TaxID=381431 RepID=A0A4R7NRM1_9GAMM|nr:SIR2 family protein [Panacagrimonas perspica]TDU23289.1 SIR2-like protein [Panacagrimonas perspica]